MSRVAFLLLRQLGYVICKESSMRLAWINIALLIMVMPDSIRVAFAADPAWFILFPSHPAWLSIESPMLIMLGCFFLGLAGLGRIALDRQ